MRYRFLLCIFVSSFFTGLFAQEFSFISNDTVASCISDYRDGFYARTADCIHNALLGLTTHSDSIEAYKLLALSYGMINQIEKAKTYFSTVIEMDSVIEIDTLVFPPHIALIFNQVNLEKKMLRLEKTRQHSQISEDLQKKKNVAIPLLLSSAILTAGGAAYCFYNGYIAKNEYSNLQNNQTMRNKKWKEYACYIAGGIGFTIASGVTTGLFFRTIRKNSTKDISSYGNGVLIVYNF